MKPIVIDNSIVLAWCLADEEHQVAEQAMRLAVEHGAVVPSICERFTKRGRFGGWRRRIGNRPKAADSVCRIFPSAYCVAIITTTGATCGLGMAA